MVRAPCCEKMGLKRGPWTPEEDDILISHIRKHGHGNWRALPKQSGLSRCGKSCRLRWTNYLRPDIKRGNFTREEEESIISLHELMGNRWSAIAGKLPGRTDNEIKNVWHTHLKKRLLNNKCSKSNSSKMIKPAFSRCQEFNQNTTTSPSYSSSTTMSQPQSYSGINNQEADMESFEIDESFWTAEDLSSPASVNENNWWEPRSLDPYSLVDENSSITNNTDDQSQQLQFQPSDQIEPVFDHDMHYWYSLFIGSGGFAELPEF